MGPVPDKSGPSKRERERAMKIYRVRHLDRVGDPVGYTYHLNKREAKTNDHPTIPDTHIDPEIECVNVAFNKWDILELLNDWGGHP